MRLMGLVIAAVGFAMFAAPAYAQSVSDPLLLAPLQIEKVFSASVNGSTLATNEWTYTVPAGREFRLEEATAFSQPGQASSAQAQVLTANGMALVTAWSNGFVTPGQAVATWVGAVFFPAGSVLNGTVVNSGDSAIFLYVGIHGTEFNAP